MIGKEKCKALKEIRKQIADENDIPYVVSQCTHKGECKGTCPKCEAELKYLEKELALRQSLGKAVAVVGISMSVCTSLTACSPVQPLADLIDHVTGGDDELAGDVQVTEGVLPDPNVDIQGGLVETESEFTVTPSEEDD